jgi:hypothetical protein
MIDKEPEINFMTVCFEKKGSEVQFGIDKNSEVGDIYGLELIGKDEKTYKFQLKKLYHQSK